MQSTKKEYIPTMVCVGMHWISARPDLTHLLNSIKILRRDNLLHAGHAPEQRAGGCPLLRFKVPQKILPDLCHVSG